MIRRLNPTYLCTYAPSAHVPSLLSGGHQYRGGVSPCALCTQTRARVSVCVGVRVWERLAAEKQKQSNAPLRYVLLWGRCIWQHIGLFGNTLVWDRL